MKRLLSIILSFCFLHGIAQETVPTFKKRIYKARIFSGDTVILKGYLANISDSALLISTKKQRFAAPNKNGKAVKEVPYSVIPELVIKRKGNISKGFWIGALSGLTVGIIVGTIEDHNTRETGELNFGSNGGAYGFLGFAGGGLLGLLISSTFKKTFIIGGNKQEFDSMKVSVLEMTYNKSAGK